ncbi:MAG: TerC family protein [Myxococcales bacterium]|nr:TerC family protein [Myxococcales bacterium]
MIELLSDPAVWAAFATLTVMEIVLGIDNIVFIAILSSALPEEKQAAARKLGLLVAMVTRIALLFCISWIMGLTAPLFSVLTHGFSGRDLILLLGGLFLIGKATVEIHKKLESTADQHANPPSVHSFWGVVVQIGLIDIVFSLDSVITAVGMAESLAIMVTAIVLAIVAMFLYADAVSAFIERHPTIKMLALSFLLLIGVMLIAEGFGKHVDKAYIYFAMGFSLLVELLNLQVVKQLRGGVRNT